MLTLTENARAAVRGLTTEAGLPESGGVRIALTEDQTQLEMSLVAEPLASDHAVGPDDAKVFVSEETSPVLTGHTLDAAQTPEGIGFSLQAQEPDA